jgi:surfeit locus 1 family protein
VRVVLPIWLLVPLVIAAELVLLGLGFWQWQRYGAKQELEAAFRARTAGAPLAVAQLDALPEADRDFQLVQLSGRWDTDHLFRVSNRYRSSIRGEEAIVPLLLDEGGGGGRAVLIDRGWYPLEERERVLAELSAQTQGTVHGLTRRRPDLSGGPLTNGTWSRFDAPTMAATLPYPTAGWVLIEGDLVAADDLGASRQLPVTGWVPFQNEIPHFEYAMTWWGMALILPVFMAARVITGRKRTAEAGDAIASL